MASEPYAEHEVLSCCLFPAMTVNVHLRVAFDRFFFAQLAY